MSDVVKKKGYKGAGISYFDIYDSINAMQIPFPDTYSGIFEEKRCFVTRHDVDHDIDNAVRFARAEAERSIKSCYLILHTARYFDYSDHLAECIAEIYHLGHEVGFHNNALANYLKTGKDPEKEIRESLDFIRGSGVPVTGTVPHGDPLCMRSGFMNSDIWEPNKYGITLSLEDFGLKHIYAFQFIHFLGDGGGGWNGVIRTDYHVENGRIIPGAGLTAGLMLKVIDRFNECPNGLLQWNAHPHWWEVTL